MLERILVEGRGTLPASIGEVLRHYALDVVLPGTPADDGRPVGLVVDVTCEALDLDAEPTEDWTVAGQTVPAERLREVHLDWYAQNPQAVEVGMRKYADQLRLLGLTG